MTKGEGQSAGHEADYTPSSCSVKAVRNLKISTLTEKPWIPGRRMRIAACLPWDCRESRRKSSVRLSPLPTFLSFSHKYEAVPAIHQPLSWVRRPTEWLRCFAQYKSTLVSKTAPRLLSFKLVSVDFRWQRSCFSSQERHQYYKTRQFYRMRFSTYWFNYMI